MSKQLQPTSLALGFNRFERWKFDRLQRRILKMLHSHGGVTINLCGAVDDHGRRYVELFGRIRIPAEEFVDYSDEEIYALVRYQLQVTGKRSADLEKTEEMNCHVETASAR